MKNSVQQGKALESSNNSVCHKVKKAKMYACLILFYNKNICQCSFKITGKVNNLVSALRHNTGTTELVYTKRAALECLFFSSFFIFFFFPSHSVFIHSTSPEIHKHSLEEYVVIFEVYITSTHMPKLIPTYTHFDT